MEVELLKALLQALQQNNSELKAIRRLLEAQNREFPALLSGPEATN